MRHAVEMLQSAHQAKCVHKVEKFKTATELCQLAKLSNALQNGLYAINTSILLIVREIVVVPMLMEGKATTLLLKICQKLKNNKNGDSCNENHCFLVFVAYDVLNF